MKKQNFIHNSHRQAHDCKKGRPDGRPQKSVINIHKCRVITTGCFVCTNLPVELRFALLP